MSGTDDQDAEPTLNAPGEAGPTGIEADGEAPDHEDGAGEDGQDGDQDAEPTQNAPGSAGPDA